MEAVAAVLAEWPVADVREALRGSDIRMPAAPLPESDVSRWLAESSLRMLDANDDIDEIRLMLVGTFVTRAIKRRLADSRPTDSARSQRLRPALEQLEDAFATSRTRKQSRTTLVSRGRRRAA